MRRTCSGRSRSCSRSEQPEAASLEGCDGWAPQAGLVAPLRQAQQLPAVLAGPYAAGFSPGMLEMRFDSMRTRPHPLPNAQCSLRACSCTSGSSCIGRNCWRLYRLAEYCRDTTGIPCAAP